VRDRRRPRIAKRGTGAESGGASTSRYRLPHQHPYDEWDGLEQLDIFQSEGVKPEEVIVSHIGFEPDPLDYSERMLRRGTNISFDRIGMAAFFPDEHWVGIVVNAVKKGYVRQTMISHDAGISVYGLDIASGEKVFDDFTYIPHVFIPKLQREAGVTDSQINMMLEENPQPVLAF
jgi:phosphotriesterase-related protein